MNCLFIRDDSWHSCQLFLGPIRLVGFEEFIGFGHLGAELFHEVGVGFREVGLFGGVFREVEEHGGGGGGWGDGGVEGVGEFEFPGAAAEGSGVGVGVEDEVAGGGGFVVEEEG